MPELPELEVARERLGPRLRDRVVEDVIISRRFGFLLRTPPEQLADTLARHRVIDLARRGKFLLLRTDGPVLVVNPMLGGRVAWSHARERAADSVLVRVVLDGGEELRLLDRARMARIYLCDPQALDAVPGFAELGPEATEVTLDDWRRRIRRHPGELKSLLRNQAFVAGVGNAYSDEILWAAGLLPLRRRSTLRAADVDRLWSATQDTLRWAIESIRLQDDDVRERQNRDFLRVHLRGGQPCLRCGHRISEITARGEVTSFCRGCQL